MASTLAAQAYDDLVQEFLTEEGVTLSAERHLLVQRTLDQHTAFAFLKGDDLALWLPVQRTQDLIARGFARPFTVNGHESEGIVLVGDTTLWSELAREAHEHMGEPPVGGQS